MNSLQELWEEILKILSRQLTPTAINAWFADCRPVELEDCRLILHTSTDFKRTIITQRYGEAIRSALSDLFSANFELLVLAGDEINDFESTAREENALPEMEGYTFDRFIVGNSNKFAHAASLAVANNPGYAYNPLFIYGDSGLGKTHLLKAIKNEIESSNPDLKVAFVTCEDFTNEFLDLLRVGRGAEFRNRYRPVDVLLIDDIQFIAGKQSTEEEFLNTFNALYDRHKQIVMAADRKPNEMKTLADRLRTRFEQGLLADIQQPDYETRVAIVKSKAGLLGLEIPDEVAEFVASRLKSHTRQLESAVKKLSAYHKLSGDPLSLSMAQNAIKDTIVEDAEAGVDEEKILEEISRTLSVPVDEICGRKQTADVSFARKVAAYVLHETTNYSTKKIGDVLGGKDHSTIVYYLRSVDKDKKTNTKLRNTVDDIIKNIKGK